MNMQTEGKIKNSSLTRELFSKQIEAGSLNKSGVRCFFIISLQLTQKLWESPAHVATNKH